MKNPDPKKNKKEKGFFSGLGKISFSCKTFL